MEKLVFCCGKCSGTPPEPSLKLKGKVMTKVSHRQKKWGNLLQQKLIYFTPQSFLNKRAQIPSVNSLRSPLITQIIQFRQEKFEFHGGRFKTWQSWTLLLGKNDPITIFESNSWKLERSNSSQNCRGSNIFGWKMKTLVTIPLSTEQNLQKRWDHRTF